MTIDLNRLKSMSKEQLIDIARQVNAPVHHANKPETIVENIINTVMQQSIANPDKQKQEQKPEKKEAVFLTESELESALAGLKERYKAFTTTYDHEARCVVMKYNDGRYRHSETMSLSCSLPKFIRKATEIARGPLVMRALRQEDWGNLGGNAAKNGYTETVLAG